MTSLHRRSLLTAVLAFLLILSTACSGNDDGSDASQERDPAKQTREESEEENRGILAAEVKVMNRLLEAGTLGPAPEVYLHMETTARDRIPKDQTTNSTAFPESEYRFYTPDFRIVPGEEMTTGQLLAFRSWIRTEPIKARADDELIEARKAYFNPDQEER